MAATLASIALATVTSEALIIRHAPSTWNAEKKLQGQGVLISKGDTRFITIEEARRIHSADIYQIIAGPGGETLLDCAILTEAGREKASNLGEKICSELSPGIRVKVVSSDLLRCKQTTEIVLKILQASGFDAEFELDPRLREANHGRLSGMFAEDREISGMSVPGYRNDERYKAYKARPEDAEDYYSFAMDPEYGESYRAVAERVDAAVKEAIAKYPDRKVIVVTHGGSMRALYARLTETKGRLPEDTGKLVESCTLMRVDFSDASSKAKVSIDP